MTDPILVHRPAGQAAQLILMFHGVGGDPENMVGIGHRLAQEYPDAAVLSIPGRQRSDFGNGYQWFSVRDVTEANRPARVADALPDFGATVRQWQEALGIDAARTVLIGFSQGAIMSLESTQQGEPLAGRIVALSGRFAKEPVAVSHSTTVHFIHGKEDGVMHYGFSVGAAERLTTLGSNVTVDIVPGLGHQVSAQVVALLIDRLKAAASAT